MQLLVEYLCLRRINRIYLIEFASIEFASGVNPIFGLTPEALPKNWSPEVQGISSDKLIRKYELVAFYLM